MPLRRLAIGDTADVARDSAAVCIPVYGAADLFSECLRSVLRHTPTHVPILIADDASPDPEIERLVAELGESNSTRHQLLYVRQPSNRGFVENMNVSFAALAPADVIILNSDCVVAAEWFERLRDAALCDARVATASTLSNNGTILSVPRRNKPSARLPEGWDLETAAAAVAEASHRLRPQIPTGIGHCLYVRRAALDLVGDFDTAFSPGYGEEVDFSQRCLHHGMSHVVADDVLVLHHGAASFSPNGGKSPTQVEHDLIVAGRYPYHDMWAQVEAASRLGPLARSLSTARRALTSASVTVDGRCLTEVVTGTQVHALELITAIARAGGIRVRVVVPPEPDAQVRELLGLLPDVELITAADVDHKLERTDVVHRPYQVTSYDDIEFLRSLGDRLVITQQDLIAYQNPVYFPDYYAFEYYREVSRRVLGAADRVVCFSSYVAGEVKDFQLTSPERLQVIYIGTDHQLALQRPAPVPPEGAAEIGEAPFLLCLGTDFVHKNRVFAMRMLDALRRDQGWDGKLVFAGAKVACGSSDQEEAAYLAAHPDLARHVLDVGVATEGEKAWLMGNARAVAYPTAQEGFGLLPFEAAEAGIPCLFARLASLSELLPAGIDTIVPWDASATAARCIGLLKDGREREEHVASLRAAAAGLTWDKTGRALVAAYLEVADTPATEHLELVEIAGFSIDQLDRDALALVGPDGSLPSDLVRPFLAISRRPWLRIPILGSIRATHRLLYFLTHGRLPKKPAHERRRARLAGERGDDESV